MDSLETKYITTESGLRIAYSEWKAKEDAAGSSIPTLVCLPSLGDVRNEYRNLYPLLQTTFKRILMCDLRGMGDSDVGFKSYTPLDSGKDTVALLEQLNLTNVFLCGNSMAAASVLYTTVTSPSRIAGTILCSPFAWDHNMPFGVPTLLNILLNTCTGPSFWTMYYKGLYTIKPCPVDDLDKYCHSLKKNLSESGRMTALRGHVFGKKAPCVFDWSKLHDRPVLVVLGSKDPDFPSIDKEIQGFHERLPQTHGKVVVLEGAGHYPMVELPKDTANAITEFVSSIPFSLMVGNQDTR